MFRNLDYHLECGGRRLLEHMHRTEGGKRQALGEAFGRLGGTGTRVGLFYPGILESQVTIPHPVSIMDR